MTLIFFIYYLFSLVSCLFMENHDWSISTTTAWIAMTLCLAVRGPQRMNPKYVGDPRPAAQAVHIFLLYCELSSHLQDEFAQTQHKHSAFPEDES